MISERAVDALCSLSTFCHSSARSRAGYYSGGPRRDGDVCVGRAVRELRCHACALDCPLTNVPPSEFFRAHAEAAPRCPYVASKEFRAGWRAAHRTLAAAVPAPLPCASCGREVKSWLLSCFRCGTARANGRAMRDICREENGWWDRNPTSLHPAHPDAAQAAILSAITDPTAVIARARELAAGGETQLALHVIDLLAQAPGDDALLQEARQLKAELCHKRAEEIRPYVSKALYASSANLLERGQTSWSKTG